MSEKYQAWSILELMGHRRLAGFVEEVELAGKGMLRIDVPDGDGGFSASQFYSPDSLYSITPTPEDIARAFAQNNQPKPVTLWELPQLKAPVNKQAARDIDELDEGSEDKDKKTVLHLKTSAPEIGPKV